MVSMNSIFDFGFKDTRGNVISLSQHQGKALLLVNTATRCGFAPQLEELEALHEKYTNKGLVVIGFPCNQFGGQEPETNDSVVGVCKINFGVTFTLSEKIDVNGKNTHPIFEFLKNNSQSVMGKRIKWNFTKFLVAPDGQTIERFAPATTPNAIIPDIERLLKA